MKSDLREINSLTQNSRERERERSTGCTKLVDYISGQKVNATPEETEAVQVFAQELVKNYGYTKDLIQTHPQFRVKKSPSDISKSLPVDIAVFKGKEHNDQNLFIIVECKNKDKKNGISQLKDYLNFSNATIGVWFNGEGRICLQKIWVNNKISYKEILDIPRNGERLEDIGLYKRKDLIKPHNLKTTFKIIRNYLFGSADSVTRDETLASQLINILFCKIYSEKFTKPEDQIEFRAGINEDIHYVGKRIRNIFDNVKGRTVKGEHKKGEYEDVFEEKDTLDLDDASITYVVGALQKWCLMDAERDVIADAFEVFISHTLKGSQGQFFTPRNVVKFIVDFLDPNCNETIIDPACGTGGFLIESLRHIWNNIEKEGKKFEWTEKQILKEKEEAAFNCIRGIEKDSFLAKVTKAYMAIIGDGKSGIFCANSLKKPEEWHKENKLNNIELNSFDVAVANPPFGSKISVEGKELLSQYDLARKWKCDDKTDSSISKIKKRECPEILFIERIIQFLKVGGRAGIVLPDGIFNDSEKYVREWLLKNVKIIGIVDLCKEAFQPNTQTKTSLLFFEKIKKDKAIVENYEVFLGVAYFCGHNRRGLKIEEDDLPNILKNFIKWKNGGTFKQDKNSFLAKTNELKESDLWIPKHYSPLYLEKIIKIKKKYPNIKKLSEIATIVKGDEVGSSNYISFIDRNSSDIPFIRTGDLVNFVVNSIPDNFVEERIFNNLKQDLKSNDILFTKDGKIGITAMLTPSDKIVIGSGVVRIRIKDEWKDKITQEYLFAVLSNKFTGYYQAVRNTVVAATIPHLRPRRLENFEIPLLPDQEIKKITNLIRESLELKTKSKDLDKETIDIFNKV